MPYFVKVFALGSLESRGVFRIMAAEAELIRGFSCWLQIFWLSRLSLEAVDRRDFLMAGDTLHRIHQIVGVVVNHVAR